jgi:hypothetical protein
MLDIYVLLTIFLIIWHFLYLRKIVDAANWQVQKYCQDNNIQFIALARKSNRLKFSKRLGLYWLTRFELEFSGDGQSSYVGLAEMQGLKLFNVNLPPYRIE